MYSYSKAIIVGAAVGLLLAAACVTQAPPIAQAQTPEQRFYAARGEYAIWLGLAVTYAESPGAHPDVVAALVRAHERAKPALAAARALLFQPSSPERDERLTAYTRSILAAVAEIRRALQPRTTTPPSTTDEDQPS